MTTANQPFSKELSKWLQSSQKKTVGSMLDLFDEKGFAFFFLVLMIIPATPIPTGGLVAVFEIIVIFVALQLVAGREDLLLPKFLRNIELSENTRTKILPFLLKRVRFFEGFSKPRFASLIHQKWFRMQLGLMVILFTLTALIAPPFTGLDTLPSLGVVIVALGIILDDLLVVGLGYLVGLIGVGVVFVLSISIIDAISRLI